MSKFVTRIADGKADKRLTSLWLTSFPNDSIDYVEGFLAHLPQDTVTMVGECNGEPATMLFLLPAKARFRGELYPVRYLYAGCTHPDYRGRGYYRELMSAAAVKVAELNENAIYLHPADDMLTATYQRLGYKAGICGCQLQKSAEWQSVSSSVDEYVHHRENLINQLSRKSVFWDTNEQTVRFFIADAVSGNAQMFRDDNGVALMHDDKIIESLSLAGLKSNDAFCLWLPINSSSLADLMNEFGGNTGLVGE